MKDRILKIVSLVLLLIFIVLIIVSIFHKSESFQQDTQTIDIILCKADWCGHCKHFIPIWTQLEKGFGNNFNFIIYDSGTNSKDISNLPVKITGFPTILFRNNNKIVIYNKGRDYNTIAGILSSIIETNDIISVN